MQLQRCWQSRATTAPLRRSLDAHHLYSSCQAAYSTVSAQQPAAAAPRMATQALPQQLTPVVEATGKIGRTEVALRLPQEPPCAQIRVLQWNILADGLAQNGDFVKVPSEVLEWSFRAPLMLAEILEADADLVCLQECNHYDELLALLSPRGYAGAFYAKRCSPACRYDCPPDGLAVFYRTARFQQRGPVSGHAYVSETGQSQSQGFLAVRLHDAVAGRELMVVTTHLKAKEGGEMDSVRLHQAQQLLGWLTASVVQAPAPLWVAPAAAAALHVNGTSTAHSNGVSTAHNLGTIATAIAAAAAAKLNGVANGVHALAGSGGNGTSNGVTHHLNGNGNGTHAHASTNGAAAPARAASPPRATSPPRAASPPRATSPPRAASPPRVGGGGGGGINGVHAACGSELGHASTSGRGSGGGSNGVHVLPPPDHAAWWAAQRAAAGAKGGASRLVGVPTIITGDFNTTEASPACRAFVSHPLGLQSLWADMPLEDHLPAVPLADDGGSGAGSAAPSASTSGRRRGLADEFTTWKYRTNGESKRTIDYILYTPASLRPVRRWRMLTTEEIGPAGLPSAGYASDHVAVCATFEWDAATAAALKGLVVPPVPPVGVPPAVSRYGDWAAASVEESCRSDDWEA